MANLQRITKKIWQSSMTTSLNYSTGKLTSTLPFSTKYHWHHDHANPWEILLIWMKSQSQSNVCITAKLQARLSVITTDILKELSEEGIDFLTHMLQWYWSDPTIDFQSWHLTKLLTLYKGKGKPLDPNNWRGTCPKETSSNIVSSIIAARLLKHLKALGFSLVA